MQELINNPITRVNFKHLLALHKSNQLFSFCMQKSFKHKSTQIGSLVQRKYKNQTDERDLTMFYPLKTYDYLILKFATAKIENVNTYPTFVATAMH